MIVDIVSIGKYPDPIINNMNLLMSMVVTSSKQDFFTYRESHFLLIYKFVYNRYYCFWVYSLNKLLFSQHFIGANLKKFYRGGGRQM